MHSKKPLSIAIGTLAAVSFSLTAQADNANPFDVEDLNQGMLLAAVEEPEEEGKCGEGRCGEGKCGEGKCGDKDKDKDKDEDEEGEGRCGEGTCGAA